MFSKRTLTFSAMSIMALVLIAGSACGSDTQDSKVASSGDDSDAQIAAANENDPTTIEPIDPGAVSMGMPIAGDLGADGDMIAIGSEGIPDPTDGTRLNDDELFPSGESRDGVDADVRLEPEEPVPPGQLLG